MSKQLYQGVKVRTAFELTKAGDLCAPTEENRRARKPGLDGIVGSCIPGLPERYWVEHRDGSFGAYLPNELTIL